MSQRGLPVVLFVPKEQTPVVGFPAVVRNAHGLAFEDGVGPILLVASSNGFAEKWQGTLERWAIRCVTEEELARAVAPTSAILVVASDGLAVGGGLQRFREVAERDKEPVAWVRRGRALAAYVPDAARFGGSSAPGTLLDGVLADSSVRRVEAAAGEWIPLETPEDERAAESRLFAALSHGRDGFISQFDRKISTAISRQLARTAVTPNQITAASLLIALAGAVLVASPDWLTCLLGTLVVWFSSILDGCDGELARLKLMTSKSGRSFDLAGDYIANFTLIGAIVLHVARTRPELPLGPLAIALAVGVSLSGLCAWYVFLRDPKRRPAGFERTLQRLASRDFLYLVVPLAALGHLEWFLYGAAVGSNLFWASLLVLATTRRS